MNNIKCPLCSSNSFSKYHLEKKFIISQLNNYFDSPCPEDIIECDYSVYECNSCKFEFSNPQIEGNELFYKWITNFDKYYNKHRWEYDFLDQFIASDNYHSILDVGCGNGVFFDVISKRNNIDLFGLDLSSKSIDTCHKKGYSNTYKSTLKEFLKTNSGLKFDLITSFHVLEHISEPIEFLQNLVSLLNETGVLFISTPYSPMSFEYDWFDVLNNPPHHLGRYNLSSYKKIAEQLNLNVSFNFPKTHNPLTAALESFTLSKKMLFPKSKVEIVKLILKYPYEFSRHLIYQIKRDKEGGSYVPNVILVKFTKN
jgi:2-polyprenyl-3-methyl-5-hydroxy-6-metoxy-1,4-benzoquinol methylase